MQTIEFIQTTPGNLSQLIKTALQDFKTELRAELAKEFQPKESPRCLTTEEFCGMLFNELKQKVEQWAEDKGILDKGTPQAQAHKTLEEASEIVTAITQNDRTGIIDGIDDTLVTLIIQAKMNDLDILEYAYNEIANRKGEMINGTFVKEK